MTQTAHTPEPWQAETIPSAALPNERPWIGRLEEHRYAALVCGDTQPEATANAARIVACVNACEGIADPEVVPEAIEALRGVLRNIEKSDQWWMDIPDRGGFDADNIRAILSKLGGNKA